MAIDSNEVPDSDEEYELKGEVDIGAKLISALKDLKKTGKDKKVLKEEVQGSEQVITDLKVKLEEAKRIEDSLTEQLMENVKEK